MPGYKKPKMTGETREQIRKREERLQEESRERARKKREDFMKGKKPQFNAKLKQAAKQGKLDNSPKFKSAVEKAMMYKPQMNKGPYTMKLGRESAVRNTPGPFRAEVPYMYEAKKPMEFKKSKPSEKAKKALEEGADTYDTRKYMGHKAKKKPNLFKGQIRKAVDTAKKADKAYRSEGNKKDPDYMKMMNKRK